ncbi:transcriptional regulator with XRE-family HTH domain [Amycolatopsis bartoniae]|uniref:helix-turn-helix transcriptional regulator n=1 Tax=Amycolatopsis bartoniae TaxID=941986 RepID=UPI001195FE59|nr:helix-turn-helix transcriptional regulator [Amycolatopsis bartoniae]MBB2936519.1 transcriptional regulator with XRE-family HTH domain [Amycolatopsis bartoniae]TVT11005.1 helix-turn-helix domain-containing protein [Amycolatopsis bartoniae]
MSVRDGSGLAEFLSTCRARVSPEQVGLGQESTRRRVPGLRREELARLAGVSVDYYTRLEQGRSRSASAEVLDALAVALRLDEAERQHLFDLARSEPARRQRRARPQRVDPATLRLIETLEEVCCPAFVLGRRLDVLAHNRLAGALITEFRALPASRRNQARFVFLDPHARELYADWAAVASDTVAMLRLDAGRYPHDPQLSALVGELSIHSEEFRRWWPDHKVHRRTTGTKAYRHPLVGELTVEYQALHPAGDRDQTLFVYTTEPGSASDTSLRLLAHWHDQEQRDVSVDTR